MGPQEMKRRRREGSSRRRRRASRSPSAGPSSATATSSSTCARFALMREACDAPVVFDGTHSVQRPGRGAGVSGGEPRYIPHARAGGHRGRSATRSSSRCTRSPRGAPSDATNMLPLERAAAAAGGGARHPGRRSGGRASSRCAESTRSRRVAGAIRLVVLDVDGVLTDGGIYLGATERRRAGGDEALRDHRRARDPAAPESRDRGGDRHRPRVGVGSPARRGAGDRGVPSGPDAQRSCRSSARSSSGSGLRWDEAAFLGDDLPDIPVLKRVGLPAAVANAVPEVRELAALDRDARRRGRARCASSPRRS